MVLVFLDFPENLDNMLKHHKNHYRSATTMGYSSGSGKYSDEKSYTFEKRSRSWTNAGKLFEYRITMSYTYLTYKNSETKKV